MDTFDLFNEPFEFLEGEGNFLPIETTEDECDITTELNDILLDRPASSQPVPTPLARPIDLPSQRKHYGLLTFSTFRIPMLFRLSTNLYVPYVRFSYALDVLDQHQSTTRRSSILDMIKNLPILDMTPAEVVYYDQLIQSLSATMELLVEQHTDWSNKLLSVALLDCLLGTLDCSTSCFQTNDFNVEKWQSLLELMREEVKSRWTIAETLVNAQTEKQTDLSTESLCISSGNMAQRRSFFEKRLDLSFVEQSGGFVQIDSFVFPFIKCSRTNLIYLHIDDIGQRCHQYLLLPPSFIHRFASDSSISHAYEILSEHARDNFSWNTIRGNIYMSKRLPNPHREDDDGGSGEMKFLSLDVLLRVKGMCFVQLFENSSLEYIITNYKNHFGRQFVLDDSTRQGGLINDDIPYLRLGKQDAFCRSWIPTETKSARIMTHDERLFINCMLLYHGHWTMVLSREQRWYLEELDEDVLSSPMTLCDREYYERQQRKLIIHC